MHLSKSVTLLVTLGALSLAVVGSTLTACDDDTQDSFTVRPIVQQIPYGCSTTGVPCTTDKLCCSGKCEASGVCAAPADASADAASDGSVVDHDAGDAGDSGDGGDGGS